MEPKIPLALCSECTLQKRPFVPPYTPHNAKVFVIGEGPGAYEVKEGKPFVGQSGKLLEAVMAEYGVDFEEVGRSNVVCCRPPNNREPTAKEIRCCKTRLVAELDAFEGDVIIPVGKTAGDAIVGPDMKISERRGHWFDWDGKKVMPTWHPAYILRRPSVAREFFGDIKRALTQKNRGPHFLTNQPHVTHILTPGQLRQALGEAEATTVAFDLETDQVVWYDTPDGKADEILMMGIAWEKDHGIVIPGEMLRYDDETKEILNGFFAREDLVFIAHNGKFDTIFLRTHDIHARVDFDTMLAHYALWEETGGHGLKQLALEYYGLEDYEQGLVQLYLKSRNDRYSKVPYEDLAAYCMWDVCVTRQLGFDLKEEMEREDVIEMFNELLMPMQAALTEVEWRGIPISREHVEQWQEKLFDHCDVLEDEMGQIAGEPGLNPRSPMQVSNVIYNVRGLPRPRVRGVKPSSTAKKALMHIKPGQDEFIDKLREYRRVHKINRSYLKNILLFADENDRVHPSALIHGTEVGRLSFRNPAIQTIPRPYEDMYGAIVRSSFVAPFGYLFITADYSQAELRVAAILSGDPFLLSVYREGRDLHTEVAIAMYGEDWTPAQRVLTKMFNFSYLYGGSEYSFAEDAGLPIDVAKRFVGDYNAIMPILSEYRASQLALARYQGYVTGPFGRKRRFPLITGQNLSDVRKAAVHAPVAGASSDLTQLSLIEAVKQGHEVVLTIHDSIGEIAKEQEADYMAQQLQRIMVDTATKHFPQVPWIVDVDISDRWCPLPEEIHGESVRTTFG